VDAILAGEGYIEENPVSAGLLDWPWSSRVRQAKPPVPPDSHFSSAQLEI
jgi:hypothetical protein